MGSSAAPSATGFRTAPRALPANFRPAFSSTNSIGTVPLAARRGSCGPTCIKPHARASISVEPADFLRLAGVQLDT
jgi:hypothetical protein